VRGGGELGRRWHDGGRRLNKKNAMADLIAVAEFLAQEKYTAPGRTVLTGKGAGGLLVTAAAHLRPEMWRGVVADAPFVDLINTLMDESLPGSLAKSEEWGSPKAKAEYDYLKSYSPYDNLTAREYPAMLVLGGLNDSQVMYWEPAKYAARLRAVKTDRNPVLLRMNLSAGHDGPSGRYDRLREQSVVNAWILQQLGVRR
jgi:oligopeptidase B